MLPNRGGRPPSCLGRDANVLDRLVASHVTAGRHHRASFPTRQRSVDDVVQHVEYFVTHAELREFLPRQVWCQELDTQNAVARIEIEHDTVGNLELSRGMSFGR